MNIKRIDSRCYAAIITKDGQWQKSEEYSSEDYTETLIFNEQGKLVEACYGEEYHFLFTGVFDQQYLPSCLLILTPLLFFLIPFQ